MTVLNNEPLRTYTGTGTLDTYAYPFKIYKAADIKVTRTTIADGTELVLTYGVDFTLTGILAENGGNVVLSAGNLSALYQLTVELEMEYLQETQYSVADPFPAKTHETALDKIVRMVQQIVAKLGRALIVPLTWEDPIVMPTPEAGKIPGWGQSDPSLMENYANPTVSAAAAAASAAAALVSENNAETAETNAETAETNAETAATTATTQAGIATTQASNASASAAAALTSENNAETAETNAETAETNAEAAQVAAETARDQAVTAKNAAEAAEVNAETAETNAETAETNAETAASNAATSESNAALSAAKLLGTSTSSVLIGTGSKAFTTQTGKFFEFGRFLNIVSDANPTVNYMNGQVTAYNTGTGALTVEVSDIGGSGTLADWSIRVSGKTGTAGAAGATGANGSAIRNLIINGAFNVWQRGTSFTGLTNGGQKYTADRWLWSENGSPDGIFTVQKTADGPTIAQAGRYVPECLEIVCTGSETAVAADDQFNISQRIEGNNTKVLGFGQTGAKSIRVSFWMKSSTTGVQCVALINGAGDRVYVKEVTISVADTWEFKEFTVAGDTTGTWLYDTGIGLNLRFVQMAGTDYQGTPDVWTASSTLRATANQVNLAVSGRYVRFALVQLEVGTTTSAFEDRDWEKELSLCKRYYYKTFPYATAPAQNAGLTGTVTYRALVAGLTPHSFCITHPVHMRVAPTVTFYNPSASNANWRNASDSTDSGAGSTDVIGEQFFNIRNPQVGGDAVSKRMDVHFDCAAEL